MASCPKCGNKKLRKEKGRPQRCTRCGPKPEPGQFTKEEASNG